MAQELFTRQETSRARHLRVRASLVGMSALLIWGLAGCGDPDDGGGGGGYLTSQVTAPHGR